MRLRTVTPWVLIGLIGAVFGSAIVRLADRVSTFTPDPGHYRVENALDKLAIVTSIPAALWIVGSAIMCLVLWRFFSRLIAAQGCTAPAEVSLVGFLPLIVASAVLLVLGDPETQSGRLWLTLGAGLACAGTAVIMSFIVLWPGWDHTDPWQPGTGFIWSTSIVLYLLLGMWMAAIMEPTGDEPHYLLGMHSLVHDGDLDISNNHANQDYLNFYPTEIHGAQMLATRRGISLPKHSIGLMVLGAPFYALGGRMAVSAMEALICAILAGVVFTYVSRLENRAVGFRTWSGILLAAPLVLYPGQIYPNALTGLLVGLALYLSGKDRLISRIAGGVALGLVPWFHLGTLPLAVGVMGLVAWSTRRSVFTMIAAALMPWMGLMVFNFYYWGAPTPPVSTYGTFSFHTVPVALAGQLLDQEAGIFWVAPLWWLLLPGMVVALKKGNGRIPTLLLIGWLVYVSTFSWWFGGWCPTGRFLLPALVLLSVPVGAVITKFGWIARAHWLIGGVCTIVLTAFPFFRFNAHDGSHAVLDAFGGTGGVVSASLPSVVQVDPIVWAVWLTGTGTWIWYGVRRSDRQ